jgi:hypothetical protein
MNASKEHAAPRAVEGLAADGLTPAPARPRPVTMYDRPNISDGDDGARDRIVEKVERLVAQLAGGR